MNIEWLSFPKNENLIFEYGVYETPMGKLLLVSWKKSLVSIAFVASQKEALQEVQSQFPKATFFRQENPVHKQFIQYLRAPKSYQKTFLISTSGTPFQTRVWKILAKVPFGKTVFYSDLAKTLRQPTAVRAVANVVAKNPLAILIPCHRVLPRSGGIGKYHWGTKNKSALLTWERLASAK